MLDVFPFMIEKLTLGLLQPPVAGHPMYVEISCQLSMLLLAFAGFISSIEYPSTVASKNCSSFEVDFPKRICEETSVCLPPGNKTDSLLSHTLQECKPHNTWHDTAYQKNRLEGFAVLLIYLVWVHQKKFEKNKGSSRSGQLDICMSGHQQI